jgi:ferredoxin
MRRWFQIFFLGAFAVLFCLSPFVESLLVPPDLFLRIDPLLMLSRALAARELTWALVPALLVLGTALAAGRVFCGYMCPLGTLFDLTRTAGRPAQRIRLRRFKYCLLTALGLCALLGLNLAGLFDPLALLTRIAAVVLYPLAMLLGNAALDLLRPLFEHAGQLPLARATLPAPVFTANILVVLCLAGLLVLNAVSHRYWCSNLCPLGALLGLAGRLGCVKRRVADSCIDCMACARICPSGAVAANPRLTSHAECLVCNRCVEVCPVGAIAFRPGRAGAAERHQPPDLSRRAVMLSAGLGALAALSSRVAPDAAVHGGPVLRPPGAVPERLFLRRCVRCGYCLQVCPTNTLQPCLLESGLEGLWSPRLLPRRAGCDQTCALCGRVCPTEAIRPLALEEKKHAKIGTAFIETDRCLVWARDRLCLICDEQCPYDAIVFRWQDGMRRPHVVENRCNGCGFCEEQCPVEGVSAIRVTAEGALRLAGGSYREHARLRQLDFRDDPGDDGFFLNESQAQGHSAGETPGIPSGFLQR